MIFRSVSRSVLVVFMTLTLAAVCQACPTCKDGIADGSQHAGMIRGYFWSILFMMSMPFLTFGGLATYFYYQVRRARTIQAAAGLMPASTAANQ